MASRYTEIDLKKITTIPFRRRKNKVKVEDFAKVFNPGSSFSSYVESLPAILAGQDLRDVVQALISARKKGKPVILMMGAAVVKCGLSPIIIDLMKRRVITHLALNGAGVIHDVEIAFWGETSEDVAVNIQDGTFGMVRETAEHVNSTIAAGAAASLGYGEAFGKMLTNAKAPFKKHSLLYQGYRLNIPVTVHVAIGTEIIHQHPNASGKAIGDLSHRDFRILTNTVCGLGNGGVIFNLGSAVTLPEVFLKTFTIARNIGHALKNFTAVNMDMIMHYRAINNVVSRPTDKSGKGYVLTGRHEIMVPLLAAMVKSKMRKNNFK